MGRADAKGRLLRAIRAYGQMERGAAHRGVAWRTRRPPAARGVSVGQMRILLHYAAGAAWQRDLASLAGRGLEIDCCDEADDARFYALLPEAEVLWHLLRP